MSKSRATGTRWESALVTWFRDAGFTYAERRAQRGTKDGGDLTGIAPGWMLEAKAEQKITLAAYMDESAAQARNTGARFFAAIVKRRRRGTGDAYVVMPLHVFTALLLASDELPAFEPSGVGR